MKTFVTYAACGIFAIALYAAFVAIGPAQLASAGSVNTTERYEFVETGTGPIEFTADPKVESYFYGVSVHFNTTQANSTSMVVSLDSYRGEEYDYIFYDAVLTDQDWYYLSPWTPGWHMEDGDKIVVAYPNETGNTYGLKVTVGNRRR